MLALTAAPGLQSGLEQTRPAPSKRRRLGARVQRTPCPQKSRAQSLVGNRPGAEHVPDEGLNLSPCRLSEAPNLRLQGPTSTQYPTVQVPYEDGRVAKALSLFSEVFEGAQTHRGVDVPSCAEVLQELRRRRDPGHE